MILVQRHRIVDVICRKTVLFCKYCHLIISDFSFPSAAVVYTVVLTYIHSDFIAITIVVPSLGGFGIMQSVGLMVTIRLFGCNRLATH